MKTKPMTFEEMTKTTDDSYLYPYNVTDDVKAVLYNWFRFRRVASNKFFPVWYYRKIDLVYNQFLQQLRTEPGISDYDWIVQNYREYQSYTMGTGEESRNSNGERTDNTQVTEDGTSDHIREDSANSTVTSDFIGHTKVDTDTKSLEKTTPQSLSYDDLHQGDFPELGWRYPSGQAETIANNVTDDKNDTTTKTIQSGDGSDNIENHNQRDIDGLQTLKDSSQTIANQKSLNRQLQSGRSEAVAKLLDEAVNFIKATNSMKWLIQQLDTCFLSIYDEEDYDE